MMRKLIAAAALVLGIALYAGAPAPSSLPLQAAKSQTQAKTTRLQITRGPVVEYVSAHHAVVGWTTDLNSSSLLKYGTSESNLNLSERSGWQRKSHRIDVSRLKANTTYYFQVSSVAKGDGAVTGKIESFKTTDRGDRPVRYPERH